MEYTEALEYINGTSWLGKKPCLDRITQLLAKLGDPQDGIKFVHIAGTNGKGSCAAMIASILKAAGYKTGLFTSPYLVRFNERMRINGHEIENGELCSLVAAIKPAADAMEDHPSEFEMITAAAMLYFKNNGCDIAVLEAGLGGRFDATNVITSPECSVIMNIGLDHTKVLGGTVEKIAAEKAGIIKSGCPCVLYSQQESVMDVIRARCDEAGAPLTVTDPAALEPRFDSLDGQSFAYRGVEYALPLLGRNQLYNAAAALDAVEALRNRGFAVDAHAAEAGLYAAEWPARFEVVSDEPYFIVDAGHNPQGAQTAADNLKNYFPAQRRVILMGVMADKDWRGMADILSGAGSEFVAVTPSSPRALPAAELAAYIEGLGKDVTVCDTVEDGVRSALEKAGEDGMACAVGSIYMCGAVRGCFGLGGKTI
jgi:dihydrofolate synthase/folylpolyglutamate synthase